MSSRLEGLFSPGGTAAADAAGALACCALQQNPGFINLSGARHEEKPPLKSALAVPFLEMPHSRDCRKLPRLADIRKGQMPECQPFLIAVNEARQMI